MSKRVFNKKGITLVEIIVSIAILGIIVTPLSSLFVTTVRNNSMAKDILIANQLAQSSMEEAMKEIQSGNFLVDSDGIIQNPIRTTTVDGKYQITTRIEIANDSFNMEPLTEGNSIDNFDAIINLVNIYNDDVLELDISSDIKLFKESTLLFSGIYSNDPIQIKLNCNTNLKNVIINVTNTSNRIVNIYKYYNEGNDVIAINTLYGEVNSFENINEDSSYSIVDRNVVYRISVQVDRDSKKLAEIVSFETRVGTFQ